MGRGRSWKRFTERLHLKVMTCCGSRWAVPSPRGGGTLSIPSDDEFAELPYHDVSDEEEAIILATATATAEEQHNDNNNFIMPGGDFGCEMNLATALAAERELRAAAVVEEAPVIMSLLRFLESGKEDKAVEAEEAVSEKEERGEEQWECCVCMRRRKGSAFIPCGHAFCRRCAREVRATRGTCALCNHNIVDVLDIF